MWQQYAGFAVYIAKLSESSPPPPGALSPRKESYCEKDGKSTVTAKKI